MSKLFELHSLGNIELKNRIVMAPMTRCRAIGNIPNELMATYYGQRAGVGLIVTEGTSPSPNGLGYARIPGIYSQEQVEGWKKVTHAVHEKGGKIFVQIMHTGRVSHQANMPKGAKLLAPSAIAAPGQMYSDSEGMQDHPVPKEMSIEEIKETIDEYVSAAKNAIEAGFDGVELHGANGYLIDQFLNANVNKRTDEYGGTHEKRNRFAIEIAQKVAEAIGAEKVGIRLSPYGAVNGMGEFEGTEEAYELLSKELSEIGIAYIRIVDHSSMGAPSVPNSIKEKIRNAFKGTVILSGGYEKERAEQDLNANKGDLIAIGRPLISNPDLIERIKNGNELAEPNADLFYTPDEKGYTDYPAMVG